MSNKQRYYETIFEIYDKCIAEVAIIKHSNFGFFNYNPELTLYDFAKDTTHMASTVANNLLDLLVRVYVLKNYITGNNFNPFEDLPPGPERNTLTETYFSLCTDIMHDRRDILCQNIFTDEDHRYKFLDKIGVLALYAKFA
jgi:hypothetical protein